MAHIKPPVAHRAITRTIIHMGIGVGGGGGVKFMIVAGWVNNAELLAAFIIWLCSSTSSLAGTSENKYKAAACLWRCCSARASLTRWASGVNRWAPTRVVIWPSRASWRPIAFMSIGRSSAWVEVVIKKEMAAAHNNRVINECNLFFISKAIPFCERYQFHIKSFFDHNYGEMGRTYEDCRNKISATLISPNRLT